MIEGIKLITPDGYVGYYRNHTEHWVWLSQKASGIKIFPYPLAPNDNIENWPTTNEKCNIQERYIMKSKLRHCWIKLSGKKQKCTRCGVTKEFFNTPPRWIYELNGQDYKILPNCK